MTMAYTGKNCPYCQFPLKRESDVVVCAECKIPHHRGCWHENSGCTTFGCKGNLSGRSGSSEIYDNTLKERTDDRITLPIKKKTSKIIAAVIVSGLLLYGGISLFDGGDEDAYLLPTGQAEAGQSTGDLNDEGAAHDQVAPKNGAAASPMVVDLVSFSPTGAEVKFIHNNWQILDGNQLVLCFGDEKDEAEKSLQIIKHYQINQFYFIGRSDLSCRYLPFTYLLASGKAPSGSFPGEDCVSICPISAEVKYINNRWKITDAAGSRWYFDFCDNENAARQALAAIKEHGFTKSCFVGRPGPSFKYLRK